MAGKLKCFVASAFGHVDVDQIYEKAIRPVLRELGSEALRVDRVEHNDDIDDKIFEMLRASDFCIADLTHARPSVYYEAGFAQGTDRPVIYIVRGDHFRQRENDPEGNLRVHFDLQMRNIIAWTGPNDAFRTRLRRRIRTVIRPLLLEQKQRESNKSEVRQFSLLSEHDRLASLSAGAGQLLKRRGFKQIPLTSRYSGKEVRLSRGQLNEHQGCYFRISKSTFQEVTVVANSRLQLPTFINPAHPHTYQSPKEEAGTKRSESLVVGACLNFVRESTLSTFFSTDTPLGDKMFRCELDSKYRKKPSSIVYAVIDGVKSSVQFTERLAAVLRRLNIDSQ